MISIAELERQVRACTLCKADLPLEPKPIIQMHENARVLIAGQAPGRVTHHAGQPFDDASGNRLREWLGVDREIFYDPECFAIVPMGLCFPGTGKQGDLPPRPECAITWRDPILSALGNIQLTLVIGQYAQRYHLSQKAKSRSVTEQVKAWRDTWPAIMPLPHPSPRNNRWLAQNPWFERELIPALQEQVKTVLKEKFKE